MKLLDLKRGTMAYVEDGYGDPILYIHGLGASGTEDFPFLFPYLKGYRNVAPDLFGYGHSTKQIDLYDFKIQAQALADLINILGLNKVNVVGHSMGGTIALELFHQFPNLIKSLIICEGFIQKGTGLFSRAIMSIGPLEKFEKEYSGWVESFAPSHESSLADRQFFKTLSLADPVALYQSSFQLVKEMPFEPDLIQKVHLPLLWVVGEKSWNASTGNKMRALKISVSEVKEAGHGMILDQPEHFASVIREFLSRSDQQKFDSN